MNKQYKKEQVIDYMIKLGEMNRPQEKAFRNVIYLKEEIKQRGSSPDLEKKLNFAERTYEFEKQDKKLYHRFLNSSKDMFMAAGTATILGTLLYATGDLLGNRDINLTTRMMDYANTAMNIGLTTSLSAFGGSVSLFFKTMLVDIPKLNKIKPERDDYS